jgi:polygalacturonase
MSRFGIPLTVVLLISVPVFSQDTRTVTEPRIPGVCTAVKAKLQVRDGNLDPADDSKLDTQRIQDAIDNCAPGNSVALRRDGQNGAFLAGPLELRQGVTLLVERDVILFGSRDPHQYEKSPGTCGVVTEKDLRGCKPLIHIVGATDSAVMGDGIIDGRGGANLLGQDFSWWDLAQEAKVKNAYQNVPRIIVADRADNFTLYRITLKNSPNFHVIVMRTKGFTAWNVKIDSPKTARNTDGIDPSSSMNVSILHSFIRAGDDNVAIKAGSNGPARNITIAHNHFYSGHGMSIGSETNGNVDHVLVQDLTIDGADNGIRIKSNSTRGGFVHGVRYEDVCIQNTKNPIVLDPFYSKERGTMVPNFDDITLKNVRVLTPGKITLLGTDEYHRSNLTFDGVVVDGYAPKLLLAMNAHIKIGPGGLSFAPSGDDVMVYGTPGKAIGPNCENRFVPFPAEQAPNPGQLKQKSKLIVSPDGKADFTSVQAAVDALPDTGGTIQLLPGTYREVVEISKANVRLLGDVKNPSKAVIVNDRSAGTAGGTFNSFTVSVTGDDFYSEGITVQNDFAQRNPSATQGTQAVALSVRGDRSVFRNVRILGAQDTLYAAAKSCESDTGPCVPSRQLYQDCYIEGHVDFIFGDAKAVFKNCEIRAIAHETVFLTAQSRRYPKQESGFAFHQCRVTAAPGVSELYLGRPWRRYSTVVFLNSSFPKQTATSHWREWRPGETHALETAFYAEYQSAGPGANRSPGDPRIRHLTESEAKSFSVDQFLQGADHWSPVLPDRN